MADDNGAYSPYGNKTYYYDIIQSDDTLKIINMTNKRKTENTHKVSKIFYKCKANLCFKRKTIRLINIKDPKTLDKILFAYVWDKGTSELEKIIRPQPHGNCTKSTSEYVRLNRSSLIEIKNVSVKSGSISRNYNQLIKNNTLDSLSNLVRSKNQLYTHRHLQNKARSKNVKTHDEYADALLNRTKSNKA